MDNELQFDQVPRPAGAAACTTCQGGLPGAYFQANGQVLCERCAEAVRNLFQAREGAFGRLLKATGLGIGGGLAGGAVYTAVLALAHINAALITILIGWLVGKGVSKGSGGRGGVGYQLLAVAITYLSIGFSAALAEVLSTDAAQGSIFAGAFICIVGALIGPVLIGMESILGAIIIFFGLLQAWQSNKAVKVEITGPHALAAVPPPMPVSESAQPQGA